MVEAGSSSSISAQHLSVDDACARVIAFYLPQYHQIPENDRWWGEGFTDWVNVRGALPQFEGHAQPKVPGALGYYDLRDVETHHAQASLARAHGISGFCYYAYWFEGRRLLEAPLEIVAANEDLAMPYAICWANEPWTRRWDGREGDVLIGQRHSPSRDSEFINDIAEHLGDARYIRVEGRPLLLIYRAGLLTDAQRTTDNMRERAVKLGLGNPFLAMVQSFADRNPTQFGFDAAVEFPPHGLWPRRSIPRSELTPHADFAGELVRYDDVVSAALSRAQPGFTWFRGVMPAWDNTPRRGRRARVFIGSTPEKFQLWLEETLTSTYLFHSPSRRLVFVNAWNEWAEGATLEPDSLRGDQYLQAVGEALRATDSLAGDTARDWATAAGAARLEDRRSSWRSRHPVQPEKQGVRSSLRRHFAVRRPLKRLERALRSVTHLR